MRKFIVQQWVTVDNIAAEEDGGMSFVAAQPFAVSTLRTILLFSLLGIPGPTNAACFCIIPEVLEAFAQADAVFVGEVIETVEPKASDEKAPD